MVPVHTQDLLWYVLLGKEKKKKVPVYKGEVDGLYQQSQTDKSVGWM